MGGLTVNDFMSENELFAEVDAAVERPCIDVARREIAMLQELLDRAYAHAAKPDCKTCYGTGRMQDGGGCVCLP